MKIFFHTVFFILVFKTVSAQELPFNSQIFVNPYYYNYIYVFVNTKLPLIAMM